MTRPARTRVGIIGGGLIARDLVARLTAAGAGLDLAFVAVRDTGRHRGLPGVIAMDGLADALAAGVDVVVEAAAPEAVVAHGAVVLATCDLLPLSMTALADDDLRATLERIAERSGTRLLMPAGALVGAASLEAPSAPWVSVTVTMEKPPGSILASDPALEHPVAGRRVLHDGSVREAAQRYPRNVNAMVVAALVTLGLDGTRGVLVADPGLTDARLRIEADAADGSSLRIERVQPMTGVSGTEMGAAAWRSLRAATGTAPSMTVA